VGVPVGLNAAGAPPGSADLQASDRWREASEDYSKSLADLSGIPSGSRFDDGVGARPLIERAPGQLPSAGRIW